MPARPSDRHTFEKKRVKRWEVKINIYEVNFIMRRRRKLYWGFIARDRSAAHSCYIACAADLFHLHTIFKPSVRTSHEAHSVSATECNRLMLFGETVAVYCENHTEHINTLCEHFRPYITGNTLRLYYRAQPVNIVWGNSRCLL
jgi:hypothetical protein